jgi:transcriptional regulator of acetoin/glycerol metabolism
MRRHADRVFSALDTHTPHAASWRRCVEVHGLDPEQRRRPVRLTHAELAEARDTAADLLAASGEALDGLFLAVGGAGFCVILTDVRGVALERRGLHREQQTLDGLDLCPGAIWDEAGVGTNGIGTALAEKRPVAIHRDKHFLSANTALSCATAPVRDAEGRLVAAIDVSACRHDLDEPTLGLLLHAARDASQRIETALFLRAHAGARIVLAPGVGGRPGLLALDRDDLLVGADGPARRALGIDAAAIAARPPAARWLEAEDDTAREGFEDAERRALRLALARTGGNVSAAASALGVSRVTLHRKMKRLGLR